MSRLLKSGIVAVVALFPLAIAGSALWTYLDGPAYLEARNQCRLFDERDYVTDTCHVNWWDKSVNVTFNATATAIDSYCAKTNDLFSFKMADAWVLKISTPYAAGGPVARCRFRSQYMAD